MFCDNPLLAAFFLTPAFAAAGALCIGIPILIHILNRRRYKILHWAAMEYLLQAMRKNRRRLKFEQWILLATRCALLALLGMALARPLGCDNNSAAALSGQRNGMHVIVIDNGYTMAYEADRLNAKTHLDQAKVMASEYVHRLASGSESVILITTGSPGAAAAKSAVHSEFGTAQAVIAEPSYNLDSCRAAVGRIEQSYGTSDLPGAMNLALQLIKDKNANIHKTLDIFTDGSRALVGAHAEALKQIGPQLASAFRVTLYNLGKNGQWNQAVLDVGPTTNLVNTKFSADFAADVQGFGTGPNPSLQWKLDDVTLAGGGVVPLDKGALPQKLTNKSLTGGPRVISASLMSDDRLKIDNTRYRVVDVVSELKVLIVEGQRGLVALSNSGAFLDLALEGRSAEPGKSDSYVTPELIGDLDLGSKVLNQYSAVVLADVAQISEPQAQQLETFVKQGGSLMIFMGDSVNRDNYNSVLLAQKANGQQRRLLPGKLIKLMSSEQKPFLFDFNPQGVLHPYLTDFRGESKTGLDTAQVYKYWQVEIDPKAQAERVLDYLPTASSPAAGPAAAAGSAALAKDPAITVQAVDHGRVVFVSTTANSDWTSFPAKPAYVSVMIDLLSGSVRSGDRWLNLTVGQALEVPPSLGLTAAPTLVDSAKHPIPVGEADAKDKPNDGTPIFRSAPLTKPGIYRLSMGNRTMPVAVNVPSDGADVRKVPNESIRKALKDIDMTLEDDALPPDAVAHESSADYGWPLMLIVLCLAAAECFMAMRFGHYKKK